MYLEKRPQNWALNRRANKQSITFGMVILSTSMRDQNFKENQNLILASLKSKEAFDKDIPLKNGYCLEVIARNKDEDGEPFTYTFEFHKDTWHATEKDYFDLINGYKRIKKDTSSILKYNSVTITKVICHHALDESF